MKTTSKAFLLSSMFLFISCLMAGNKYGSILSLDTNKNRDRRAELDIYGRVSELSVSPDEKIWLVTAMGDIFYCVNIDSNWHSLYMKSESGESLGLNDRHLERISFFNKDTAILTGYISADKPGFNESGYYLTKNGGKTWSLLDFGGDSWIYCAFVDKQGNAWMGGSSGEIYYSNDFGQHWETRNSPYNNTSRLHSIFMADANTGISGALHNDIYGTNNNWKTSYRIESPLDQLLYSTNKSYGDAKIEKIILWKEYIVVNENGNIYYTKHDKIAWQEFPLNIIDFELDPKSDNIFAITDSLKVVSFTNPDSFQVIVNNTLPTQPKDLKVVNNALYILSNENELFKISANAMTHVIPYTTDKKIDNLNIIKAGNDITWGAKGKQLYLADRSNMNWYRENVLHFHIENIHLINDSIALLWDGVRNNYIYSLSDHEAKLYLPASPLKSFLTSPVKTVTINAGSMGCFHHYANEVCYERKNDTTLETTASVTLKYQDEKISKFKHTLSSNNLNSVLAQINENPGAIPDIKDFNITEKDKEDYLKLVDDQLNGKHKNYQEENHVIDKEFYYAVPNMLDTISTSTLEAVLNKQEGWFSTTSYWSGILLINETNDTLALTKNYYVETIPWNLPWRVEYHGQYFNCYDIAFSQLINSCIPDDFMDKEVYSNSLFIMKLADYLWIQEKTK